MIQLSRSQIEELVAVDAGTAQAVRDAYVSVSDGRADVPPVGHIAFPQANGDCHIKYGYIAGDDVFAVKIAAGFYDNPSKGRPSSTGVVLAFSATTGQLQAILNDEGYLTDLRTGLGGAVATLAMCRASARRFLIVGTGTQAHWLARALSGLAEGEIEIAVWGRNVDRARELSDRLSAVGISIDIEIDLSAASGRADAILTATPSTVPLIKSEWVQPGCHITALGADGPGKQELDTDLVARADVRVSDSLSQSLGHGEFAHARAAGKISTENCVELGAVLNGMARGRTREDEITVADLTGVATQDIAMARTVLKRAAQTGEI